MNKSEFKFVGLIISRHVFRNVNIKSNTNIALAGVAQWIEHWPVNQRVTGSIPSQGTCLGCRPGPHSGDVQEAPTH